MFAAPPKRHGAAVGGAAFATHDPANNSVSYAMYMPNASVPHQRQVYQRQESTAEPAREIKPAQPSAVVSLNVPLHLSTALPRAVTAATTAEKRPLVPLGAPTPRPPTPIVGAAPQVPALHNLQHSGGNYYHHQQSLAQSVAPSRYETPTRTMQVEPRAALEEVSEAEHPPFPDEQRQAHWSQQQQQQQQTSNKPFARESHQQQQWSNDRLSFPDERLHSESLTHIQEATGYNSDNFDDEEDNEEQAHSVGDREPAQREEKKRKHSRRRREHKTPSSAHRARTGSQKKAAASKPRTPWSRKTKHIVFMLVSAIVSMLVVFVLLALTNPTFVQKSLPEHIDNGSIQAPLDMRKAAVLSGVAGVATFAMPFLWRHCAPYAASFLPWKL